MPLDKNSLVTLHILLLSNAIRTSLIPFSAGSGSSVGQLNLITHTLFVSSHLVSSILLLMYNQLCMSDNQLLRVVSVRVDNLESCPYYN